jgi:hypothetical protein
MKAGFFEGFFPIDPDSSLDGLHSIATEEGVRRVILKAVKGRSSVGLAIGTLPEFACDDPLGECALSTPKLPNRLEMKDFSIGEE